MAVGLSFVATAAPAPAASKPGASGLVDRQGPIAPKSGFRAIVNAGVVTVAWSAIQPSADAFRTDAIDTGIRKARNRGSRVKLRISAGVDAPAWAKTLDGPPPCIVDPPSTSNCKTVPRFWTPNFLAAWDALMAALAARYDGEALVSSVRIAACTTLTAEPFQRQVSSGENRRQLRNAGYTTALDEECHRRQLEIHAARWPTTTGELALHPFQRLTAGGFEHDQAFTRRMMVLCRGLLTERCVLGHTSLGKTYPAGSPERQMYADLADLGPPIWMQTASLQKLGGTCRDLLAALDEGVARGSSSVELPLNYDDKCRPRDLEPFDRRLEANPTS